LEIAENAQRDAEMVGDANERAVDSAFGEKERGGVEAKDVAEALHHWNSCSFDCS